MALAATLFPCLGFSSLGMCSYDPTQPMPTYFTIGDAVSALAFTLAVQQLLKPIYEFRLRAYGLKIGYLTAAVLLGAFCSLVATLVPNFPFLRGGFWSYPIVWELVGGILIGLAYGVTVFVTLRPARLHSFNLISFCQAGSRLLSVASEEDRVNFANDLLQPENLESLILHASAWERAEWQATTVEFERLESIGAPKSFSGRPPISAFYLFAHRRELELATIANTFLQIISDPELCAVLVRKSPWLTAFALRELANNKQHSDTLKPFVQAIGCQAILQEESMVAKEVSYTGFSIVPLLSNSLFENWHFLSQYDPLGGLHLVMPDDPTEGFVRRLNSASKNILTTAIKEGDYWPQGYFYSVQAAYGSLSTHWAIERSRNRMTGHNVYFHMGVEKLGKIVFEGLSQMDLHRRKSLFVTDPEKFTYDLVDSVASIIYESLACIANEFEGVDDDAWAHAIGIFMDIYPFHDSEPEGMNPLQQHVALKLLDKLRDNMEGWYPSISRVLLAVIGPYSAHPISKKRTAFVILKDAVYKELQKLPNLYKKNAEKVSHCLPSNVKYNSSAKTLTHTYKDGRKTVTKLSELKIAAVDLSKEKNWFLG